MVTVTVTVMVKVTVTVMVTVAAVVHFGAGSLGYGIPCVEPWSEVHRSQDCNFGGLHVRWSAGSVDSVWLWLGLCSAWVW